MRQKYQTELRNLNADLDSLREQLEEETDSKTSIQRTLSRVQNDLQTYKIKFETEGSAKTEELMEGQRRLQTKLMEAEQAVEAAVSKAMSIEKAKARLAGEMEDLVIEIERQQATSNNLQKRQRQFDTTIKEWQSKVSHLQSELDAAQQESRTYSAELYRTKSTYEETTVIIESLKRDNKNLTSIDI